MGAGDGLVAHLFETPTKDWPSDLDPSLFVTSDFLFAVCGPIIEAQLGVPPGTITPADIEFHMDGATFDMTSSPWLDDFDGDGKVDVAFANRNDIHEVCLYNQKNLTHPTGALQFDYLNPLYPGPDVKDHVYYGNSSGIGQISFCPQVELVGDANDGTSYMRMVDIAGTRQLDWIEANFANKIITDSSGVNLYWDPPPFEGDQPFQGNQSGVNWLFFGKPIQAGLCLYPN